jgi:trigger factor
LKSTVEQLSPTRVRINVEVPFDELKPNFDRAYRKLAGQVRIPGFRQGKVPPRVLESRIGRAPVLDEVVNEAIPAKYMEAVNAGEVRALGRPDIEVTKIEDGDHLAFTAEVDIRPDITVPAFGELAVSVDDIEISDEDVDKQLDELRARFGTLTGVDRPAENGDFVTVDLSAAVDGEEVEEARTTGLSYEIGSGQLVEGIDDALIGATAGETKNFTTKLVAGEYEGRDAEVTVKVDNIKKRELPEADAEQVQVNDAELSERIVYQAQRFGISPDEYVQRAQQAGQLGAIFADVRRGKALASIVRQATVTDASGNTVDLDELFGAPAAPAAEEASDEAATQE